MADAPLISVVIATYQPGDGLERVMDSLDAQTLPQDRFEVVVVDDGSPDDTWVRLQSYAATRSNMRIKRIPNSGWPSRPRNLATSMARGDYVFFMDHDDSLYPDALRRMAEYATETRADVLSPKESKTSDAWWGMPALADGDLPNAAAAGGIDRMLPMVPHKLYRRAFLEQHGIRFPEARRQLWEDIYVNVEAWRHAERVAVLADTPVYLWHSSQTNNSKTYGPRGKEFWDRLEELFAFIDATLTGPEHANARRSALLHQWRSRVVTRFSRMLSEATEAETKRALERALDLQRQYVPIEWERHLGKHGWARSMLLREGRTDQLRRLWRIDERTAASVVATGTQWRDGALAVEFESRWLATKGGAPIPLRANGERILRVLPDDLVRALPPELLDVSDTLPTFRTAIALRDRGEHVSWQVAAESQPSWERVGRGVTPLARITAVIDPETAAVGRPLRQANWEVVGQVRWSGASHGTVVRTRRPNRGALLDGRSAVAYRTPGGSLNVDLSGQQRTVALAGLGEGRQPAVPDGVRLPLTAAVVQGEADLPVVVRFEPWEEGSGPSTLLPGRLRSDGAHAVIDAEGTVPPGEWRLGVQIGDGRFVRGRWNATVHRDHRIVLSIRPEDPEKRRLPAVVQRFTRLRARATRYLLRRVRRLLER